MKSSKIFSKVPIEVPNRSGFDMSHENIGTGTTGTLIPVLVDEILPNDTVSLGSNFQVQLPPMVTDFYGRIDYVLEAFFVPARLLWGGWESFMTHPTAQPQYPAGTLVEGKSKYLPAIPINPSNQEYINKFGRGSLADYLGCKVRFKTTDSNTYLNAMPFLAYHRIWDDWYRDSRIQSPLFYRPDSSTGSSGIQTVSYMPYVSGGQASSPEVFAFDKFSDGVEVCGLRQRNWSKDYFTTASYLPQAGSTAASVSFDVVDNQGTLSIAALRSANSLQK